MEKYLFDFKEEIREEKFITFYVLKHEVTGKYVGKYSKAYRCCLLRDDIKRAKKYSTVNKAIAASRTKGYKNLKVIELKEANHDGA